MWDGSFAQDVASYPVHILVGPPLGGVSLDITAKVPMESIVIEETGTLEEALCSFTIIDKALLYTALRGEWQVLITHSNETIYRGFIGRPRAEIAAIYGEQSVTCRDISSLMDRLIIKSNIVRDDIESDQARIQWLFSAVGQPIVAQGFTDWSSVQVLNPSMKKQTFPPRLTLRQALERILAASSESANYYMDYTPKLHTYDRANPETDHIAPKNINATTSPGAGEVAPEDLRIDWDTDGLVNSYYVQGRNSFGSGWYSDQDLLSGPWSTQLFGLRSAYIQAPDADTQEKAIRVASLALADTRNPVPRGSFSTFVGADELRFKGGQLIYVTSTIHGLNGSGADPGPWAGAYGSAGDQLQPLRIVNVTTRYINGAGDRIQEVEFGGRQVHRYSASIPT